MRLQTLLLLIAPVLIPLPTLAADPGQLLVSGEARREFAPDQAQLLARVDKRANSPGAAAAAAAAVVTPLLKQLEALGLAPQHIQVLGTQVGPVHEWDAKNRRQLLVGYQAVRELRLSHLALEQLGAVMQVLADADVEQVDSPQLSLADADAARRAVLQAAAEDAQQQARALAQALGVKLGRPVAIDADPDRAPMPQPLAFKAMRAEAADVAESYSHAGLIELSARVRVAFAIQ